MNWKKTDILNDEGEQVSAQAPVIISASRSTDIPTFYANWFIERWRKGYIKWKNPFNGVPLYVSFKNTRVVVFWTKNPKPMMKHIDYLDENIHNYYFQFTLNDYDEEGFEGKVPKLKNRIATFIELSEKIGRDKVIWRFDPMILTDKIGVDELLRKVETIGVQLKQHTNKLVFSFADIAIYKKVENNLKRESIKYTEFTKDTMHEFAKGLQQLSNSWGIEVATCAEAIPLEQYGISHNKCIDDDLMIKLFSGDKQLMEFLGVNNYEPAQSDLFANENMRVETKRLKDKGQREDCGCIMSKDIGQYNTCPHECVYCYANTSKEIAKKNYKSHKDNIIADTITGT